jgi:hypothetical protein
LKINIRGEVKKLRINHLPHSKPFNNPISKSKKRRNNKEVYSFLQTAEELSAPFRCSFSEELKTFGLLFIRNNSALITKATLSSNLFPV